MTRGHRQTSLGALLLVMLCLSISGAFGFHRHRFKKCDQSGFCRRNRNRERLQPITVKNNNFLVENSTFTSNLNEVEELPRKLESKITFYEDGIINVKVIEASRDDDFAARFDAASLVMTDSKVVLRSEKAKDVKDSDFYLFELPDSLGKFMFPKDGKEFGFKLVDVDGKEIVSAESLLFENHMKKPEPKPEPVPEPVPEPADEAKEEEEMEKKEEEEIERKEDEEKIPEDERIKRRDDRRREREERRKKRREEREEEERKRKEEEEERKRKKEEEEKNDPKNVDGGWDEDFDGGHDHKPNGPGAVGLDITFPQSDALYGIPEHATSHLLRNTRGKGEGSYDDPYRLYNLDVFEYEPNSPIALYGSAPILYAHDAKTGRTVGLFWLNPTETWVDLDDGASNPGTKHTRWTSEEGNVDVWILPGPSAADVARQYTSITGRPAMPPLYSQMSHQCRWNYVSSKDVSEVNEGFNKIDMPVDVIWLDIEHTEGKRYFTWDYANFPDPEELQNRLAADGRHMVTIVDPHIKRDDSYRVNSEAKQRDFFVKNHDGNGAYQGDCWPGSSSWIDFLNPSARDWWAGLYALDSYSGSTDRLGIWNDMNEPAIFRGPEETMSKDAKHFGNVEHRAIHNMYGYLNTMATYKGLSERTSDNLRPFVLTRSFFAGSQKYAAVWTGDNAAKWDHLKASIPMTLSLNIAGIVHSGADVGGFFGNPDDELIVRWYQTAAFLPFFRAHAHIETKRREPWLFSEETKSALRAAVIRRYSLQPYWSTLFYQAHHNGTSVVKPLWEEFPRDASNLGIDDEFLLGHSILVHPVTDQKATSVKVYFPNSNWYDSEKYNLVSSYALPKKEGGETDKGAEKSFDVNLNTVPVFYRGGRIVPKKERVRRSSQMMAYDPFTLVVALDQDASAEGELFVDDGSTFDFEKKNQFFFSRMKFQNGVLSAKHENKGYDLGWSVERVVVAGLKKSPSKVVATENGVAKQLAFEFVKDTNVLIIKKPVSRITSDWKVTIN